MNDVSLLYEMGIAVACLLVQMATHFDLDSQTNAVSWVLLRQVWVCLNLICVDWRAYYFTSPSLVIANIIMYYQEKFSHC
jgi:hypothetical protein